MATPYTLTLQNNSAMPWTFYVYQQLPDQASSNVFSLAWFASPYSMAPNTQITFTWTLDYGFVWRDSRTVVSGVTFYASGAYPAGLTMDNTTRFSDDNNTPTLSAPLTGNPSGSLVISSASNIPNGVFSVGISMSGAATFLTAAVPNMAHTFTPPPTQTYWIAAGTNVQVGTILDITTVNQNLEVQFPVNTYALTYALGQDNIWTWVS